MLQTQTYLIKSTLYNCMAFKEAEEGRAFVIWTFLFNISGYLHLFLWIWVTIWSHLLSPNKLHSQPTSLYGYWEICCILNVIGGKIKLHASCFMQLLLKSVKRKKGEELCISNVFIITLLTSPLLVFPCGFGLLSGVTCFGPEESYLIYFVRCVCLQGFSPSLLIRRHLHFDFVSERQLWWVLDSGLAFFVL